MEPKSFFAGLFDMSFEDFIVPRVIRIIYILSILAGALFALIQLVTGAIAGGAQAIFLVLLAPIIFFFWVLCSRIYCELILVIFRIAENTEKLIDQNQSQSDENGSE